MRKTIISAVFALGLCACETSTQHAFVRQGEILGPEQSEGAIIWLHGWCPGSQDCSRMLTPPHVNSFGRAGWDVFRLNVPPSNANHDSVGYYARARLHANLTLPRISDLRGQGYKRVVLAGYSGGAMSVLFAGTVTSDVDAVFALAPCCGEAVAGPYIPVRGFYRLLRRFEAPRLMVFFFDGERNAPDDIGADAERILKESDVHFRIYDQPHGFYGHGAGLSTAFAARFASEMIEFAMGTSDLESTRIAGVGSAFGPPFVQAIALHWDDNIPEFAGRAEFEWLESGRMKFSLQISASEGSCEGAVTPDDERMTGGDWGLVCNMTDREYPRLIHARGSFEADGGIEGAIGVGTDMQGRTVRIAFGPSP